MKKSKGFSLIELLVAMGIIAVLLALVAFGIATAQRNSRDTQRRNKLADFVLVLEDFYTTKNTYPPSGVAAAGNAYGSGFNLVVDTTTIANSGVTNRVAWTVPTNAPEAGNTWYCYGRLNGGGNYIAGVKLESGGTNGIWSFRTNGTPPAAGAVAGPSGGTGCLVI